MDSRIARRIGALADEGRAFAVCTVAKATGSVPGKPGATMLVTADGVTEGTVGGAGLEEKVRVAAVDAIRRGRGDILTFDLANWKPEGLDSVCGGTVHVAVDVVDPGPRVLVLGGGHCGQALADVMDVPGWGYVVVDARAEYATRERFPNARDAHGGVDPAKWLADADLTAFTHAYLLGHSHAIDTDALIALLPRFDGVVGVIGSNAKRHTMLEKARAAGVPEEKLARVRCPIGLDVGAETPAEIAIAVAAEVLRDVKATRS